MGILEDPSKLYFLGTGMPLFFQFGCFLILGLLVGFLCYGIYMLIYNLNGTNCKDKELISPGYCGSGWKIKPSIGNRKYEEIIGIEKFLSCLYFVLLLLTRIFCFRHARQKDSLIDMDYSSPGDYTLMISSLPRKITEEEVIRVFSNYRGGFKLAQVEKVNFAYYIGDYVKYTREKNLYDKQIIVGQMKKNPDFNKINELVRKRNSAEQSLMVVKNKFRMNPSQMFTGICFLTFKTQQDADMILNNWEISSFGKVSLKYLKCLKVAIKAMLRKYMGKWFLLMKPQNLRTSFGKTWELLKKR